MYDLIDDPLRGLKGRATKIEKCLLDPSSLYGQLAFMVVIERKAMEHQYYYKKSYFYHPSVNLS